MVRLVIIKPTALMIRLPVLSLGPATFARRMAIWLGIVPPGHLWCAATANKRVCSSAYDPKPCKRLKLILGHRAIDCKAARAINWEGIPDLTDEEAWTRLVDACKTKDLDSFRLCLKAYARSIGSEFSLPEIERSLREDKLPIYLIAKKQEVAKNQTIIDLVGNLDRQYVLTFQLSDKPKRKRMAAGWPASPEENMTRLTSAGFVQDRGIPLCSRCGGSYSLLSFARCH